MAELLWVRDTSPHAALDLATLEPGPLLVVGRAALLGGAAAGTGIVSHLAGDGLLPGWPSLLVLVGAAIAIAAVTVLTRATRRRVIFTLVGGQALMHLTLASLAGHRGELPTTGWWSHQIDHLTAQGPGMLLAHTAGALLLGLFLAFAEETLWLTLVRGLLGRRLAGWGRLRRRAAALSGALARIAPLRTSIPAIDAPGFARLPAQTHPAVVRRGPPLPAV